MDLTSVHYRQEELVERLKIECSEKFDVDNPQHQARAPAVCASLGVQDLIRKLLPAAAGGAMVGGLP